MPKPDGFFGRRPDREPVAAPGLEHAARLGDRQVGTRQMQQAEIHHHRVEAGGLERQRLGVALAKRDRRMRRRAPRDHRRREVESGRIGAARRGGGSDESRTARDVEQSRPGRAPHRVEQRFSGLPGQSPRTRPA